MWGSMVPPPWLIFLRVTGLPSCDFPGVLLPSGAEAGGSDQPVGKRRETHGPGEAEALRHREHPGAFCRAVGSQLSA